jgi:methylated-DNA-[protein]-cysteine S-methyltransferase
VRVYDIGEVDGTPYFVMTYADQGSLANQLEPGRPLSYAEFAAALGQPSAVRAAASICARNAPALFVPCHRVLRSDGSLGGFAWGLDVKRSLLSREAAA